MKAPEYMKKILGDVLVTTEGEKWAKQRKLANHGFHGESLKVNFDYVVAIDFVVDYLQTRIIKSTVLKARIPGISKICKTADEVESEKLVKGIHNSVMEMVKKIEKKVATGEADSFGSDFLVLLVNSYHDVDEKNRLSVEDLVDECRTFYTAGQETTNSLLAWTVLVLAIHTDWQEKARREVKNPHSEGFAKLKTMNMIIKKTLRLYPPVTSTVRKVGREVQLGKLVLPVNIEVLVPSLAPHHDPELWGDDDHIFKPERFVEGIAKATKYNPAAFIPFGLGPRSSVGMSFATTETKTALSIILQRYTITLSPAYVHSPFTLLMLQPEHGIQSMTPAVIASVETMLERWKQFEGKEIELFEEFRLLTSEVISRTAFDSSYLDGKKIFDMLMKLSVLTNRNMFKARLPGVSKFWKTADEIESDKLVKGIHNSVMEMVKKREEKVASGEANSFGTDFLGLLVNAYHDANKKNILSIQDLVDECKTFYSTGQETTNSALAWTVLLLAIHPDWQEKARREVIEVFGNQNPHPEGIGRLKIMTMIINETLRLYPPVNNMVRKVENEVQLGKLILPANLELVVPIMALHHDLHLWGDDVNLFKPERFAEGIANATKYNEASFIPFGLGPRSCVGMSFAMTETKTALSMILQRYTISLSPTYSHSPFIFVMLFPQHGIQNSSRAFFFLMSREIVNDFRPCIKSQITNWPERRFYSLTELITLPFLSHEKQTLCNLFVINIFLLLKYT
ncbi:hypothetical protein CRYUN_Cryun29cG0088900 [Craigia yunnanensis]